MSNLQPETKHPLPSGEELDDILIEQLQKMAYDIEAYSITDCKNYLPEYREQVQYLITASNQALLDEVMGKVIGEDTIAPKLVTGGYNHNKVVATNAENLLRFEQRQAIKEMQKRINHE